MSITPWSDLATSEGKGLTDPVLLTGLGFNNFFHDTTVGRECMVQQLGSGKPYDVHMRTGPNILELAYLDRFVTCMHLLFQGTMQVQYQGFEMS